MMKIKRLLGLLAIATIALTANAQAKIGHINSQELLASMPETDSAQKQLENFARENELVMEEMTVEYNKKYEDLIKKIEDKDYLVLKYNDDFYLAQKWFVK